MNSKALINEQKLNGEETEFYPTTFEMVETIANELKTVSKEITSILDIGCGNGNFFHHLNNCDCFRDFNADFKDPHRDYKISKHYEKYGIEKSFILTKELDSSIVMIGTDFNETNLIDKKVDFIFCNPPYSDFKSWMNKIIKTANSNYIAMIVPSRWKEDEDILKTVEKRNYEYKILDSTDFLHAERQARCKVDIIFFSPKKHAAKFRNEVYETEGNVVEPFDLWFNEVFKINADKDNISYNESAERKTIEDKLVDTSNIAETLVNFYNDDLNKLYENYKAIERLDYDVLKELHVDIENLKKGLKMKLSNLKILYWNILLDRYSKITSRICTKQRNKILGTLKDNNTIDFTLNNIYQITLWIMKNANVYFDEQITDYFLELCSLENIRDYKSNKRWNEENWKYLKENIYRSSWSKYVDKDFMKTVSNYCLDYRIITEGKCNFSTSWSNTNMCEDCINFLYDTSVIANNLGFSMPLITISKYDDIDEDEWRNKNIYTEDGELFCNIKLYKNGNRHIKFNTKFMLKLNVEMGRINGWIKNKKEACEDLGIKEEDISSIWKSNYTLEIEDCTKLLGLPDRISA